MAVRDEAQDLKNLSRQPLHLGCVKCRPSRMSARTVEPMPAAQVVEVVERIRRRDSRRPEAQLQAEIYQLLTMGALDLEVDDVARLEVPTQDGTRRRLDVEVGHCCIEVKKDLRAGNTLAEARGQLAGYVRRQSETMGQRYVGILTDGSRWHLHRLVDDELVEVDVLDAASTDADGLIVWLESVLATTAHIAPTAEQIEARLGAGSPGHKLDRDTLAGMYSAGASMPEVQVKHDLWAKLLRTAFGQGFDDTPGLFVNHTLLVLTAEAIAHAVAGFDLTHDGLTPQDVARGTRFRDSQIHGVVEEDFFDWVLDVDGGPQFVLDLMRRIARFDWTQTTDHDVLKALYTSIITPRVREALGEYYTPDWLASQMVDDVYTDPLHTRLLEPSCGSGTFLMHAVTAHLEAAEAAGMSAGDAVTSTIRHVIGMDIHPVAVALARVSYLIAIGTHRLTDPTRGRVDIPVYLGDSLQWEQHRDLLAGLSDITITTSGDDLIEGGGGALFGDDLRFPLSVLDDAVTFDRLVSDMADAAVDPTQDSRRPAVVMRSILRRAGLPEHPDDADRTAERAMLITTFDTWRRLHRSGRNHIWGYYIRNLIRPLWLTRGANKVDVLVGNPPWLAYSKMTPSMQGRYRTLAKERNLLGGRGVSGRDLSTLFVARTVELYLRDDGRFAFVMPHGILSRQSHAGFRTGKWSSRSVSLHAAFDTSWDLDAITTGFPMTSCVVRGRPARTAGALPATATAWHGRLARNGDIPWDRAAPHVTTTTTNVASTSTAPDAAESPYRARFRQGAILVPRMALLVTTDHRSAPFGAGAGRVTVQSMRTSQEKPPWKTMPSLSGTVETEFVRPVHLGETIAPYRALTPLQAVLPLGSDAILSPEEIDDHDALSRWWAGVETTWQTGRKASETKPLLERFDYHQQLSSQLPIPAHRVVYSASGTQLTAARLCDDQSVIEHKLYWARVESADEGRYLVAILNSATLLRRVQPFQAKGLLGPRDFDKYVFHIPFPLYDASNNGHRKLVDLARRAEEVADSLNLDGLKSTKARAAVRQALRTHGIEGELEQAVDAILPVVTP